MKKSFYKLILAGLFAAVIYITTAFIAIPLGIGYANLGDRFVLFSGMFLGPLYGSGAFATVSRNLVQGAVGLGGAIILCSTAKKLRLDGKFYNKPDRI